MPLGASRRKALYYQLEFGVSPSAEDSRAAPQALFEPEVVAALAAVAIGVWVFAPGALAGALPLLIVATCPLSMIGMMYMMRGGQGATSSAGAGFHSQGATQQLLEDTTEGKENGRVIEALHARVVELEARLAVESRPDEIQAAEAAAQNTAPNGD